jgi:RNA polymerase nonessential primary-like sigma factor
MYDYDYDEDMGFVTLDQLCELEEEIKEINNFVIPPYKREGFSSTVSETIKRYPVLKKEQEIKLFQDVKILGLIEDIKEAHKDPDNDKELVITDEELSVLLKYSDVNVFKSKVKRARRAQETLILSNLRLVMSLVLKENDIDHDDAFSEAVIKLQRAITKFDVSLGYKFSTYAYWWIKQGIQCARNKTSSIRIPNSIIEKLSILKKSSAKNTSEVTTLSDLSKDTGYSEEEIHLITNAHRIPRSLSQEYCGNIEGINLIADRNSMSPDEYLENRMRNEVINKFIDKNLDVLNGEIIRRRYGLYDGVEQDYKTIAKQMGLEKNQVQECLVASMKILRNPQINYQLKSC